MLDKEIIIVDDGSTDATPAILEDWARESGYFVFRHPRNRGKGAAVRTALTNARGKLTVIQDADLEYDPSDLPRLVEILRDGDVKVVYGSRYLVPNPALSWNKFRVAVSGLNLLMLLLFGQRLTDEATCYKAFETELLRQLDLQADGFEVSAEISAKLGRWHIPIKEVPISYNPRSIAEGKKIGWAMRGPRSGPCSNGDFATFHSGVRWSGNCLQKKG